MGNRGAAVCLSVVAHKKNKNQKNTNDTNGETLYLRLSSNPPDERQCVPEKPTSTPKMEDSAVCKVIIVGILLLISSVLLGISFATIPVTSVGLYWNPNTVHVDRSKVYKSGRHYVPPGSGFVTFPTSYELIEFSNRKGAVGGPLMCWTKDKQNLYIEVREGPGVSSDLLCVVPERPRQARWPRRP